MVAFQLFDHGEKVMSDRRRLGRLRMRVRGKHRLAVLRGEIDERLAEGQRGAGEHGDELALPHPVHRHVDVVAAAGDPEPARHVVAAPHDEQTVDVEEQVFARMVVRRALDISKRDGIERVAQGARIGRADDVLLAQHHQVRVMDGDQRREKQSLRVLEVLAQHPRDVFGIESHQYLRKGGLVRPATFRIALSATRRAGAAACRSRRE